MVLVGGPGLPPHPLKPLQPKQMPGRALVPAGEGMSRAGPRALLEAGEQCQLCLLSPHPAGTTCKGRVGGKGAWAACKQQQGLMRGLRPTIGSFCPCREPYRPSLYASSCGRDWLGVAGCRPSDQSLSLQGNSRQPPDCCHPVARVKELCVNGGEPPVSLCCCGRLAGSPSSKSDRST